MASRLESRESSEERERILERHSKRLEISQMEELQDPQCLIKETTTIDPIEVEDLQRFNRMGVTAKTIMDQIQTSGETSWTDLESVLSMMMSSKCMREKY